MKTTETDASVEEFLNGVTDAARRDDCFALLKMMTQITRAEPRMWGRSLIGFGRYHYRYASGREGDWFLTGFSPRKNDLTIYIIAGFEPFADLMADLGRYKTGKSCLYVRRLANIDEKALKELLRRSVTHVKTLYG